VPEALFDQVVFGKPGTGLDMKRFDFLGAAPTI